MRIRSGSTLGLLLCLPVMMLFTSAMRADTTVFSENFDGVTPGLGLTSVGQFTAVNGTNVDVVGGATFGYLCAGPESGNCVDMAGTGGNPQGDIQLTTALNLAPGTYALSFDLIGSQRGVDTSTQVIFGSYNQIFNLTSDDDTSGVVTDALVTITGSGPTQLEFIDLIPNANEGALLDNIQIASTPEPGSLALLATGLLGAGGMLRRRFKA